MIWHQTSHKTPIPVSKLAYLFSINVFCCIIYFFSNQQWTNSKTSVICLFRLSICLRALWRKIKPSLETNTPSPQTRRSHCNTTRSKNRSIIQRLRTNAGRSFGLTTVNSTIVTYQRPFPWCIAARLVVTLHITRWKQTNGVRWFILTLSCRVRMNFFKAFYIIWNEMM